jgi:hypothetical protein
MSTLSKSDIAKQLNAKSVPGEGICKSCGRIDSGYRFIHEKEELVCRLCGAKEVVPLTEETMKYRKKRMKTGIVPSYIVSTNSKSTYHVPAYVAKVIGIHKGYSF